MGDASALGAGSYEPCDTKLAQAGAVLQLCLYADRLVAAQQLTPPHVHVGAPWTEFVAQTIRVDDCAASLRHKQKCEVEPESRRWRKKSKGRFQGGRRCAHHLF